MADRKLTADQLIKEVKKHKYTSAQVHHTWKPSHKDFTGSNHQSLQDGMRNYHVGTRGWKDIGQHVTLFPDGTYLTGRPFGMNPAGIAGYNSGAFMVEMIGNFDKGHDKLEGKQLDSALKLYNYFHKQGIYIRFHREEAGKSCPGTGINKTEFMKAVKNYKPGGKYDVSAGSSGSSSSGSSSGGSSSSGPAGAKHLKDEDAYFLITTESGIKVRSNPSLSAKHTGTLAEGSSIHYYKVYENDGYRWLQYNGNSGNKIYIPYRRLGKKSWGTFHSKRPKGTKAKSKKSSSKKKKAENLRVDGYLGKLTISALQRAMGTTVDGVLSKPSLVVREIQKLVGARVDGYLGPETYRKLQAYLGTPVDGKVSKPSLMWKEVQRRLNAGTFGK